MHEPLHSFLPLGQTQDPLEHTLPPEQVIPAQGSLVTQVPLEHFLPLGHPPQHSEELMQEPLQSFLPLGQTQEPLEQTFPPEQLTPLQGSFETAVHPELALPVYPELQ